MYGRAGHSGSGAVRHGDPDYRCCVTAIVVEGKNVRNADVAFLIQVVAFLVSIITLAIILGVGR